MVEKVNWGCRRSVRDGVCVCFRKEPNHSAGFSLEANSRGIIRQSNESALREGLVCFIS